MSRPESHPTSGALLEYWLRDGDPAAADAIDEHLLQCDACGEALDALIALGAGVREAFLAGAVAVAASPAFVQRLAAGGLKVRSYRLSHNGSVNCTVAPDDEVLAAVLEAPLQGIGRLDVLTQMSTAPDSPTRLEDVPFDPQSGTVVLVSRLAEVKRLPANTLQVSLLAVEAGGTREVSRYTFVHRPWSGQ